MRIVRYGVCRSGPRGINGERDSVQQAEGGVHAAALGLGIRRGALSVCAKYVPNWGVGMKQRLDTSVRKESCI